MAVTQCVECDKEIDVEPRLVGLHVVCNYCGAEMEVVSTDPLELDLAQEEDNVWDSTTDDELDELDDMDDDELEEDELDDFDDDDDFDDLDDDDDFEYDYDDDDDFDDDDDDFDDFDDDDDDRW